VWENREASLSTTTERKYLAPAELRPKTIERGGEKKKKRKYLTEKRKTRPSLSYKKRLAEGRGGNGVEKMTTSVYSGQPKPEEREKEPFPSTVIPSGKGKGGYTAPFRKKKKGKRKDALTCPSNWGKGKGEREKIYFLPSRNSIRRKERM